MRSKEKNRKKYNYSAQEISDHMLTVKNSLPRLAYVCDIEPYNGDYSYQSLKNYFKAAEKILEQRGNKATLAADKIVTSMIHDYGHDAITQLKRDHYNTQLETLVLNSHTENTCKVIDNHVVPNVGFVYLEPMTHNGRAPFYSSEKILGPWHIKTLWFNLSILLFMSVCMILCLMYDFPGRIIRKK